MKPTNLVVTALIAGLAGAAFADDRYPPDWPVDKRVELKDGGALVIYRDGKTAVEDRLGRPDRGVQPGSAVEARNGERISVQSNETGRLESLQPHGPWGG